MRIFEKIRKSHRSDNQGATLIELLVALAVFSFLVVMVANIVQPIIKTQRRALALKALQENSRYAIEFMNKEIRLGEIETEPGQDLSGLSIINSADESAVYEFVDNRIKRNGEYLTSEEIKINGAFYVRESETPFKDFVSIAMKIESVGNRPEEIAEMYIQSSLSVR